ncbi:hypothetical protein [Streptomyces sp. HPF1205]|nr:hypothetical protein [Streptomyces sp. HPF1205]
MRPPWPGPRATVSAAVRAAGRAAAALLTACAVFALYALVATRGRPL